MKIITLAALIVLAPLSPALSGDPVQCPALTRIRFYPADGQAGRMLHGRFTASNEGATTGFETLAEIKEVPQEHRWSELVLPAPALYRFIKYEAPNGSWGNVAEVESYAGDQLIRGTPFGTTGSRDNAGKDFTKALDGDVTTFFDGVEPNSQYVGLDLGASVQASVPHFAPQPGTYARAQAVSIASSTPGAVIRLAGGGGTPTRTQGEPVQTPNLRAAAAWRDRCGFVVSRRAAFGIVPT
jgi:hypothetical protein